MENKKILLLSNNRGAAILAMVILIGVLCMIMFGIASTQLSTVAKEAYRTNEAFRFLNVMEEMGHAVGKAHTLGARVGACPANTSEFVIGGNRFCFDGNLGGNINAFCIQHNDGAGLDEPYCLQAVTLADNSKITSDSMYADFVIEVQAKPNLFKRLINSLVFNEAHASCPDPVDPWKCPDVQNGPGGSYTPAGPVNNIPAVPALPTTTPGATGSQVTGGSSGTNNINEEWMPQGITWSNNNEIRTPLCTADTEEWLGCVRCAHPSVTCIRIQMCPPNKPGCATPYVQRIAVY